jgi:hypothetical protein
MTRSQEMRQMVYPSRTSLTIPNLKESPTLSASHVMPPPRECNLPLAPDSTLCRSIYAVTYYGNLPITDVSFVDG